MSDERREVAERLREAALHPDADGDVWVYDVTAALGLEADEYESYFTSESVERLAELIDPTCELEQRWVTNGRPLVCSSCGKLLSPNIKWHYCPNCGTRVVRANGD